MDSRRDIQGRCSPVQNVRASHKECDSPLRNPPVPLMRLNASRSCRTDRTSPTDPLGLGWPSTPFRPPFRQTPAGHLVGQLMRQSRFVSDPATMQAADILRDLFGSVADESNKRKSGAPGSVHASEMSSRVALALHIVGLVACHFDMLLLNELANYRVSGVTLDGVWPQIVPVSRHPQSNGQGERVSRVSLGFGRHSSRGKVCHERTDGGVRFPSANSVCI